VLKKSLPPLLVIAEDFGYGSAGKLASVVERLECDVVLVGSDHAEHVIPEERILDSHPDARTAGSIASVASEYDAHLALISNTHPLSSEASSAGLNTIFVDSLPFLWTEGDDLCLEADLHCAQLYPSLPASSWPVLRRIRNLAWIEGIVPPAPAGDLSRDERTALVSFGGLTSRGLAMGEVRYPYVVLPATLRALERAGFDRVVVAGNVADEWRALVGGSGVGVEVSFEALDHAGFQRLLRSVGLLACSPGLTTLLESGAFGAFAWGWLFVRAHRRFRRAGKRDDSPRGWLFTGLCALITGYAWSMATYDSFAFIQVSFLLFLELAFGAVLLRAVREAP
jgi:hydroxymethylcytosylglucuronate/cytosylglucuronate synthase